MMRHKGYLKEDRIPRTGVCQSPGCENSKIMARGLCGKHYRHQIESEKFKPCACGCGSLTRFNFCWGHHTRLFSQEEQQRRGQLNTGESMRGSGNGVGYQKFRGQHEHRAVMEKVLGRKLRPGEIVHHKDHNKRNNKPENLEVMTQADHIRHHLHKK